MFMDINRPTDSLLEKEASAELDLNRLNLPIHLKWIFSLFQSKWGSRIFLTLYLFGIIFACLIAGIPSLRKWGGNSENGVEYNLATGSKYIELSVTTFMLAIASFLLCPLAVRYIEKSVRSLDTLRLLFDISRDNPSFFNRVEWLTHLNVFAAVVAMIMYAIFLGRGYTVAFAFTSFLPIYASVTIVMLHMEGLRTHSENFIAKLDSGQELNQQQLRDSYSSIQTPYKLISSRDSAFLLFLNLYLLLFIIVCIWDSYLWKKVIGGLLGVTIVYFIYFLEVFLFMARASEIGQKVAVSIAEYILLKRDSSYSDDDADDLCLLLSYVTISAPRVAVYGVTIRFKAAVIICGALISAAVPKMFV
jgi:hypothetical protein